MSKNALNRHYTNRYMRRRLATPAWSWVERSVRESEGPTVQELRAAKVEDWTDVSDVSDAGEPCHWDELDQLYDEWTDEDWLQMGLILMGQMYEREEQA